MNEDHKERVMATAAFVALFAFAILGGSCAAEQEANAPPPTLHSYTIVLESGSEIDISAVDCLTRQVDLRGLAESHPLLLEVECWSDNNSWFGDVFNGLAVAVIKN